MSHFLKKHTIKSDDVTRLNEVEVQQIIQVFDEKDILHAIQLAKEKNAQISIAGTKHTMGGQSLIKNGIQIDCKFFKKIWVDKEQNFAYVQPGATWGDLIKAANEFGMSPMTMQSYCSFSIGGTVSANAHGITNDFAMIESVISFEIINFNEEKIECSREKNPELFSLVIGGYGLFGIMSKIQVKLVPNTKLQMEYYSLNISEFQEFFVKSKDSKDLQIKMGRLDITNMTDVHQYYYRDLNSNKTISELALKPHSPSILSQLVYKWLMPTFRFKKLRYKIEKMIQRPLDWTTFGDRNALMYETAQSLAKLYNNLLFFIDDTFVLQEYFVPAKNFEVWVRSVKPIIIHNYKMVNLLNITIRFLNKDQECFLPYAQDDMFAFVLYFRITRNKTADQELQKICQKLIEATLELQGTFYLPYRHHYSKEQLIQSHPKIEEFFNLKQKYDPIGLFSNMWYENYSNQFEKVKIQNEKFIQERKEISLQTKKKVAALQEKKTLEEVYKVSTDFQIKIIQNQRNDSYKNTLNSIILRQKLQVFFLTQFNLENGTEMFQAISKIVWENQELDDQKVYQHFQEFLKSRPLQFLLGLKKAYKTIQQLRKQKSEFSQQIYNIFDNLGISSENSPILNVCNVGDEGRILKSIYNKLGLKHYQNYSLTTCHDKENFSDFLARGGVFFNQKVKFIQFDQIHNPIINLEDQSQDLVIILQGLHHFPQVKLQKFLKEVRRVLRPGGYFIFREHNCTPELLPLLDLAHSTFNAITGVPLSEEKQEIRAFRPIEEWREIMISGGFLDTYQYGLETDDPTEDYMLCFQKSEIEFTHDSTIFNENLSENENLENEEQEENQILNNFQELKLSKKMQSFKNSVKIQKVGGQKNKKIANVPKSRGQISEDSMIKFQPKNSCSTYWRLPEWFLVEVVEDYGKFLQHTPWYYYPYHKYIYLYWKLFFQEFIASSKNYGIFYNFLKPEGIIMDFVIGIVLLLIFFSLLIMALPLKGLLYSYKFMIEEEVLTLVSQEKINWKKIDPRIKSYVFHNLNNNNSDIEEEDQEEEEEEERKDEELKDDLNNLKQIKTEIIQEKEQIQQIKTHKKPKEDLIYIIKVPQHKKFTEIMLKISQSIKNNNTYIKEISGISNTIQIKITTPYHYDLHDLLQQPGVKKNFEFEMPTNNPEKQIQVSLSIKIQNLLQILRYIQNQEEVKIFQIYDFL